MNAAPDTAHPAGIERRVDLTVAEFRRTFSAAGRPVILTGATDGWSAMTDWTFERLRARLAGRRFVREPGRYLQLFIGGAGSGFPWLHWDLPPFHTFSTCIRGRKARVLFPPDQTPLLYPDPAAPSKLPVDLGWAWQVVE